MKRHYIISIFTTLVLILFLSSCSDLKKDLPTEESDELQIHVQGWTDTTSANFHGKAIQNNNWDMHVCQSCHGADYTGGISGKSCNICHTAPGGPQNCATCHGMPPAPALDGSTSYTAHGVGAHQIHFIGNGTYSSHSMLCDACHHMPTSIYDPAHISADGRAEVILNDPLANLTSSGITPTPTYDPSSMTCTNTFCHGAWRLPKVGSPDTTMFTTSIMTGASYAPRWNGGPVEKSCGSTTTCHTLPPNGHKPSALTICYTCHGDVMDASGNIKNKAKHINGKIDLAGGVVLAG